MRYLHIDRTPSDLSQHEDDRNTPLVNEIKSYKRQVSQIEDLIAEKTEDLSIIKSKLSTLMSKNADTPIRWKFAIKHCIEVDAEKSMYFLKSTNSIYACIAKKYSIEITRDIKNKVSTTLSIMHRAGEIGRYTRNGVSYYGIADLFKKNLTDLKKEYVQFLPDLTEIVE